MFVSLKRGGDGGLIALDSKRNFATPSDTDERCSGWVHKFGKCMGRFWENDASFAIHAALTASDGWKMTRRIQYDSLTIVAISALAFIAACVAHEAVGHAGMCIATGARVTRLTSVYFHCSNGRALTDAAGPVMNLIVGTGCWIYLKTGSMLSSYWRVFLVLAMALNLLWGSGYFVYSAVTDTGDLAFALRDLALHPKTLWLFLLGALGVCLYAGSVRLVARELPAGVPLLTAYLAAGGVSCIAALFFSGAVLPALREAALESFGASFGLLLLARRRYAEDVAMAADAIAIRSIGWIVAAVATTPVFFLTLGRGLP